VATEIVVIEARAALTREMIDAGRALVGWARERIEIVAAFWLYLDDGNRWRLHLASPMVAEEGPIATYRALQAMLDLRPGRQPYGLNDLELDDVTVIEPQSELVRLWRTVYPNGVRAGAASAHGITIAGRHFEGAYFYLL